jgi:HK97 family phage portal protein
VIIQSGGELQAVVPPPFRFATDSTIFARAGYTHSQWSQAYAQTYASQPNIRIPIDFLSGNVAQLGIHVYRRVDDNDRVRLTDHQLSRWLANPNPAMTQYRLIESLLGDLGVYKNAYWLKLRYFNETWNENAIGLLRLPPDQMRIIGGLLPRAFLWTNPATGKRQEFAPSDLVYFGGYNPLDPLMGLSHLDTLQPIVCEEAAATAHRHYYWQNASRHEGVIERPREAPKWTPGQKQTFREQWQQRFSGAGNSGLVAVLEDGMQFKPTAFSPKDSEYIQGGKQRREVTAAEFNVPQPSIGILDHATFSNIREQHKQLYQDSLGPTIEMLTQEIERQLLIECDDQDNVYIEFNIAAKLQGSFEEQASALRVLVGRPVMTANEARGRLNLPKITDDPTADQLAQQQGGPARVPGLTPADSGDPIPEDTGTGDTGDAGNALVATAIDATRARQLVRLAKHPPRERASIFFAEIERWNRELTADLAPLVGADAAARIAIRTNVELFTTLETEEVVA